MRSSWPAILCLAVSLSVAGGPARAAERVKLILDTDIGDDIDDAFAVIVALNSPEIELLGITTASGNTYQRAQIAAKLVRFSGRKDVPVLAGPGIPSSVNLGKQFEWAKDEKLPRRQLNGVDFILETVHRDPGNVVLCVVGPETNIARALERDPMLPKLVKGIVVMGGDTGPRAEYNIKQDVKAAQRVFSAGAPLAMVGLNLTLQTKLDRAAKARIWASPTPLAEAAHELTERWAGGKETDPIPHDLLALQHALGKEFVHFERRHVEVDNQGRTLIAPGPPNVLVGMAFTQGRQSIEQFQAWIVERVIAPPRTLTERKRRN